MKNPDTTVYIHKSTPFQKSQFNQIWYFCSMKNSTDRQPDFKLKMNLMVQSLLKSSLGMCKFVMLHKSHPLSQAIEQFKLIDTTHLDDFLATITNCAPGKTLLLSMKDEILIYTVLDITCKAYLTDLGDRMEQLNASQLKSSKSTFTDIRGTIMKGCEIVMEGMRETLSGDPEFDDRVDILENYVLV